MNLSFRSKLKSHELLIGTMVTLGAPEIAEILSNVGFDWLFIDAEHGPFDTLGIQRFLQAASPQTPCLVRLASADEIPIKKALDVGASGIIAPMVNSVELAEKVVRWSKYPPMGSRGVGLGRAHGYGLQFGEYIENANEEIVVVIQVEHIDAVENIEALVGVSGIDAVFVGPYDLSASLNLLGEVEHPKVLAAIERVTDVCQRANVPLGIFGISAAAVKPFIKRGYTLVVAGVDTVMLGQADQRLIAELRK